MIRRISLVNYGAFRGRSFDLGRCTVFHGPNESGKTTIFDALTEGLCTRTRANHAHMRDLRARYGEDRSVEVDREGGTPEAVDMDTFLSVYAVRNADVDIRIEGGQSWMGAVKANLFTGGVNPEQLQQALERRASTKGSLAHNRELKDLHARHEEASRQLEQLRDRRRTAHAEETQADQEAEELDAARAREAESRQELDELTRTFEVQEQIRLRARLDDTAALVSRVEQLEQATGRHRRYATDETGELDTLRAATQAATEALNTARVELEQTAQRLPALRERLHETESARMAAARAASVAAGLLDRVDEAERATASRVVRTPRWPVLVGAGLAVLASAGIAFMAAPVAVRVGATAAAVVSLVIGMLLGTRVESRIDDERRGEYVKRFLDDWRNAGVGGLGAASSLDSLRQSLMTVRAGVSSAETLVTEAGDRLREAEQAHERLAEALRGAEQKHAEAQRRAEEWYRAHGVRDRDEYVRRVTEYQGLEGQLQEARAELERACRDHECEDAGALARDLRRRLADLDEQAVPRTGVSDTEYTALRRRLEQARRDFAGLQARVHERERALVQTRAHMQGSLEGIPEKIARLSRTVEDLQGQIDARELDRKAAGIAAELVASISQDTDRVFADLAAAIDGELSCTLGAGRTVQVDGLSMDEIQAVDAGGVLRRVDLLSRGTRDAFVLAARLALAGRAGWDAPVIVLDEPLLSLDDARRAAAVGMLAAYRAANDCQMVLFTRDEALVEDVRSAFPEEELRTHDLSGT